MPHVGHGASEFNLIQRGELQQRLQKGLDIRDKSPARTLDPTVQAVVLLEDLTKQTPFLQPVERRAAGGVTVVAVAGEFGIVALVNPTGSGAILAPQRIWFAGGASAPVSWGFGDGITGLAQNNNEFFLDRRLTGTPAGQSWSGTNAALAFDDVQGRLRTGLSTSQGWVPVDGIILRPGDQFVIASETVNMEFSCHVEWLEYTSP